MVKSDRRKKISTILILAVVLLVPGFLYVSLNKLGSNEYVRLPIYGEKSLSGKMNRRMGQEIPDTSYHTIQPVNLISSSGEGQLVFEQDSVVRVVHFFYAKDKNSLSNDLLLELKKVVERFDYNDMVRFYSISLDPSDQGEDLLNVFQLHNDDKYRNWNILAADSLSILDYAQRNFLIDALQVDDKFIFGNYYILLDSKNRIRGYYDFTMRTEVKRLTDEIKVQIVEEIRNNPLKIERD